MRHALTLGIVLCLAASCGGSKSPDSPDSPDAPGDTAAISFSVGVVVKAVNYNVAPGLFAPALFATNTNNGAPDGVPSGGILSGPPTGMRVYLQSIALMQGAGATVIYSSAATHTTDSGVAVTGCQLSLTSGNLDLSVCPGLDQLDIPEGTFDSLAVTFAAVGEVQGCLNAKFANTTTSVATAGTYAYPSPPFPQNALAFTTDAVAPATLFTFCTRKDKFYYQAETAAVRAPGTTTTG